MPTRTSGWPAGRAVAVLLVVAAVATFGVGRLDRKPPDHHVVVDPWTQSWPPADAAHPPAVLDAAPAGTGDACTAAQPCALTTAQLRARQLAPTLDQDLVVRLAGGTYPIAQTLTLGPADSGSRGHRVSYEAAPGATPVLSGGYRLGGWTKVDGRDLYSAPVPAGLDTRQLFVAGHRATRARGDARPAGWTRTADGFEAPDDAMASWRNPTSIEIVSFAEWKSFRCPIDRIAGRSITMAQPCWTSANTGPPYTMNDVAWVENAYELLDQPGEWYLDRAAGRIYYEPRPGEDLATADVEATTTPTLLAIDGTREQPVHDVAIEGLTFAETSWTEPSTTAGYAVMQAGWHLGPASQPGNPDLQRVPGAVTVSHASAIRFERNTFARLGSTGLDVRAGTQDLAVVGNRFVDLSGGAVQIGEVVGDAAEPTDPRDRLERIEVRSNLVDHAGVELFDTAGIFVAYGADVSIVHNELRHLPYTGISLGWGWGTTSYAAHNVVQANRVSDVMRVLVDGGAIYTLSPQPGTVIAENELRDDVNPFGALYLDEGTRGVTVAHNVVAHAPRWLHIWTSSIRDDVVVENWSDTDAMLDEGRDILEEDNEVGLSSWPPEAQAVMDHAGLEPAYRDLATT
jgi:hypothetical protein